MEQGKVKRCARWLSTDFPHPGQWPGLAWAQPDARPGQVPRWRPRVSTLDSSAPLTPWRTSALSVRLTRGAFAATGLHGAFHHAHDLVPVALDGGGHRVGPVRQAAFAYNPYRVRDILGNHLADSERRHREGDKHRDSPAWLVM
jgi:hypothetical protein